MNRKMNKVKEWFENDSTNYGEQYDIYADDEYLEARTSTALFMAVSPHEGNGYRWMLRISTISAFDRWANSTVVEEFFDTDVELCNYLSEHKLDIYMNLLKYLSQEYDES